MAIVILSWNDAERTTECLQMLSKWTHINPRIFVVDNASSLPYQLPQFCEKMTTLISSDLNRGYSGGNNLGIKTALKDQFDFILLLNSDVQVDEAVGLALCDVMNENDKLGAVGPALVEKRKVHIGGRDIGLYQNTRVIYSKNTALSNKELDYIPGTMILIRNTVFNKIGFLDDDYFFSGEIADFCKRMTEHGLLILIAENLRAIHIKNEEKIEDNLTTYYNLRNRFLYINKHHSTSKSVLKGKWILIGFRQMLGALVRRNVGLARSIFYAMMDGLLGRFGNMNHRFISAL